VKIDNIDAMIRACMEQQAHNVSLLQACVEHLVDTVFGKKSGQTPAKN